MVVFNPVTESSSTLKSSFPSAILSCTAVNVKVVLVCPAGIVTVLVIGVTSPFSVVIFPTLIVTVVSVSLGLSK